MNSIYLVDKNGTAGSPRIEHPILADFDCLPFEFSSIKMPQTAFPGLAFLEGIRVATTTSISQCATHPRG